MPALPEVFFGADAVAGLDGRRGFLYGEKRHRQVDVLGFEPAPESAAGEEPTLESVVARRLDRAAIRGWRIVGVAVRLPDVEDREELLLEGLVAGDVLIAGPGGRRVLVHRGDCLSAVRAGGGRRPEAGGRRDARAVRSSSRGSPGSVRAPES